MPAQAEKATGGFTNLLGGLGGLAAGVAGLVGGISQLGKGGGTYDTLTGIAGIFGAIGSITGLFGGKRATGGAVDYGKTFMVGEKGPELFVPGQSGTIIANDKVREAMGSESNSPFQQNAAALQSVRQQAAMQAAPNTGPISLKFESQVINSVEYVTTDQFRKGMGESAERGRALAFQSMQNNVSTRRRLGI